MLLVVATAGLIQWLSVIELWLIAFCSVTRWPIGRLQRGIDRSVDSSCPSSLAEYRFWEGPGLRWNSGCPVCLGSKLTTGVLAQHQSVLLVREFDRRYDFDRQSGENDADERFEQEVWDWS